MNGRNFMQSDGRSCPHQQGGVLDRAATFFEQRCRAISSSGQRRDINGVDAVMRECMHDVMPSDASASEGCQAFDDEGRRDLHGPGGR